MMQIIKCGQNNGILSEIAKNKNEDANFKKVIESVQ